MNPEAHKIVDEIETLTKTAKATEAESQNWSRFIAWRTARLQVILAEQQEMSAATMERFTFWLIVLTVVLIGVALLPFASPLAEMFYHICK